VNKEMYIGILRRLSDAVRTKRPRKMQNQQLVAPARQCSCTPNGCGQEFLSKEQCDNTGASPILPWPGSSSFSPVIFTKISIEETALLWCYWQ